MDEHITAEMISGYSASDWRLYVGTKNARYLPIFRRHEGQKRFFGMNWAAFLVPTGWSFYRQLYRRGLLLLLAAVLLFAAAYTAAGALYDERIAQAVQEHSRTVAGYEAAVRELDVDEPRLTPDIEARVQLYNDTNMALFRLRCARLALLLIPQLVLHLWAGLTADCAYRNRALRRGLAEEYAGASPAMVVIALLAIAGAGAGLWLFYRFAAPLLY